MKKLALVSALALSSLLTTPAQAESSFVVGTGSAAANLNFKVVIPRVLFLGVGTGAATTPMATNSTKDTLTFDYTTNAAALGTGAAAASVTNNGPVPAGGGFPVRVFGNGGQITLTTTNPVCVDWRHFYTSPFHWYESNRPERDLDLRLLQLHGRSSRHL
jgi:hypothetical protein